MSKKLIQAAAGAGGESVYVEDVFSTYLYEGNGSSITVNNGIDLSGEGGVVWTKSRTDTNLHYLQSSETTGYLSSNNTNAIAGSNYISFGSNGYTFPYDFAGWNGSGRDYVSWSFRKQAGFFDVVTYSGNGTAGRTVSHNLGSKPAFIMIKILNSSSHGFFCYHESLGATKYLTLNTTNAANTGTGGWNNTEPTSTEFTLGSWSNVNASGFNYVAYLFAHDDQSFGDDSDESIIKCGSYTGNNSADGPTVTLGWEPQWLLIKESSASGNAWSLYDMMRNGTMDQHLRPNASDAESIAAASPEVLPQATGFKLNTSSGRVNRSQTYIYIAIRRPMKTPEAGTEVFDIDVGATAQSNPALVSAFGPVDMVTLFLQSAPTFYVGSRLQGDEYMNTQSTGATGSNGTWLYDYQNGWRSTAVNNYYSYMFKRATGFFDVVAYTGDGTSSRSLNHNLGVAPELMIIKQRSATRSWAVYSSATGTGKFLKLEDSAGVVTQSGIFDTAPTSSVFTVGSNTYVNASGGYYIAYLFATLAGISKVGSYTGTAASLDIDCGFTAGARFILIKRTDSTDDWYYWDSERGIVSGDDPYLLLNTTGVEQTNQNYVNPYSAGFTMTSNGFSSVNVSGGTYIFLAIA
jgi:hypothetical protein